MLTQCFSALDMNVTLSILPLLFKIFSRFSSMNLWKVRVLEWGARSQNVQNGSGSNIICTAVKDAAVHLESILL